jgi:hypothetical protein
MAVRHEGTQFRSQRDQALHYFSRPHQRIPRSAIEGPAAWRGVDMARRHDWVHRLDPAEVQEIRQALARAAATGRQTRELRAADFPLPGLEPLLKEMRDEVSRGRGFFLLRGLPVEEWSAEEAERFCWCLGLHLGIPGAQNPQGDLVGHVRDTLDPLDQSDGRYYKTRRFIAYHCDAADAVGLLCLRKAKSGGLSRIVSSVTIYNEMLRRHPQQVARLFEPFMIDTHGEGGVNAFPVVPCRYSNGRLRTTYHSDYFRSAGRHPGVSPLGPGDIAVLDSYERIANEEGIYLDMDLEPGDVQLISNHVVLHARTAYEDDGDPALRRHLLRLWLSFDDPLSLADRLRKKRELVRLALAVARQRFRYPSQASTSQAT